MSNTSITKLADEMFKIGKQYGVEFSLLQSSWSPSYFIAGQHKNYAAQATITQHELYEKPVEALQNAMSFIFNSIEKQIGKKLVAVGAGVGGAQYTYTTSPYATSSENQLPSNSSVPPSHRPKQEVYESMAELYELTPKNND